MHQDLIREALYGRWEAYARTSKVAFTLPPYRPRSGIDNVFVVQLETIQCLQSSLDLLAVLIVHSYANDTAILLTF